MRLPLWRRQQHEEELEEEIRSHLQMAIRDRMERGESADEAASAARRAAKVDPMIALRRE
jgi:hypothetical protein